MEGFMRLLPRGRALWPVVASGVTLVAFYAVGGEFLQWYRLDLGSMTLPNERHTYFLFWWTLLGSLATFLLLVGLTRRMALGGPGPEAAEDGASTEGAWIAVSMVAAFLVPWAIRTFLLRGAVLTDDESSYRFMAQVISGGRLWVESHPLRAFFDRGFMINDGKFYSAYFIGWPVLMVPGVYVGLTGYMNALYAALTVPPLYLVARRMAGPAAGRVATLLFLASPMLMVGAATELSHTTCMAALAWSMYFLLRAREQPGTWWTHAAVAFFFSLAFFVRPTSAIGVGVPILAWWTAAAIRWPVAVRRRAVVSFAVPAGLMALAFLYVNVAQNESPLLPSYVRMQQFMREVNYRNVGATGEVAPGAVGRYILPNAQVGEALAKTTVALVRLAFDLFGSPWLILLAGFAWAAKSARLAWLSALSFVGVHFFINDSGIDTFGPVHYFELSLPLLLLSGVGLARLTVITRTVWPNLPRSWPMAAVVAVVLVSLAGFVPVRLAAIKVIADSVNSPANAVKAAGISNAIVFTPGRFITQQCIAPTRHFVFMRPNNDPALKNDVLWVNDLGLNQDLELMRHFPGRQGYVLEWVRCHPQLRRL